MKSPLRQELESEGPHVPLSCGPSETPSSGPDLTAAQLAELSDEAKQAEYRRQFELQMSRRECPECGG